MTLLEGRVAIVTGGAQGIGLAIARDLVEHGARVVLGDLNLEAAAAAADELGQSARAVRCNVTDEEDVSRLVATAVEHFDGLDVMVNNAGITRDATMRKMGVDDFRLVLDVHLTGTWLGTRAAAAVMRSRGSGSIINISSISGKVGNLGQTNYSAAKAGIVGMTKAAAKEVARDGVRVNAIQPGLIRTAMTEAMPPDVFAEREKAIPMRRAGEPREVAGAVLFLASDLSSYMTGAVLEVGGGRLM